MRRFRGALLIAVLASCGGDEGSAPSAPTVPATPAPTLKRLLVVTHTEGFRHGSIPVAEATLAELARESGRFEVSYCRNASDVRALLSAEGLRGFDGFFFANTTGNLGIPDVPAFLSSIRSGKACLGAHSASDTYHDEPAFLHMLGGEFLTHGNETEVEARVENAGHPAAAPLAPTFRIYDEIYELVTNPRARVNVVLSLNRHPLDGHPQAGQPGDFVLAWYRDYGEGRVFYTALGHRDDVWQNRLYRQHLAGGIRWALRLDP